TESENLSFTLLILTQPKRSLQRLPRRSIVTKFSVLFIKMRIGASIISSSNKLLDRTARQNASQAILLHRWLCGVRSPPVNRNMDLRGDCFSESIDSSATHNYIRKHECKKYQRRGQTIVGADAR